MNHEVEREVGELAKLRRLEKRVFIAPRYAIECDGEAGSGTARIVQDKRGGWIRAADIDEALKEVGGE